MYVEVGKSYVRNKLEGGKNPGDSTLALLKNGFPLALRYALVLIDFRIFGHTRSRKYQILTKALKRAKTIKRTAKKKKSVYALLHGSQ